MKTIIKITLIATFCYLLPTVANAQNKKMQSMEKTATAFIKAMTDGDIAQLDKLSHSKLTYGHSGGKVENKTDFLEAFKNGSTDFVSINVSNQTIDIVGNTAILRQTIDAVTNDNNIPGSVKLNIMTVWVKQKGHWIMIARQAVKPK